MNILTLDVETTTHNKGNCFDSRNSLVCYSYVDAAGKSHCLDHRLPESLPALQDVLHQHSLVVGFNFTFDLGWLKKVGVSFEDKQIWDVQIAEFILSHQTHKFPSLNGTCEKYALEQKEDIVKTEYWDKDINTDEIPWDILSSYAKKDVELTLQCYHKQRALMTPAQIKLCYLMCQDLVILQEMTANGLYMDEEMCAARAIEIDETIAKLSTALTQFYPSVPINFGSNDHLSAFLYGGIVKEDGKEHIGFYKSGIKAGQPKYKNITIEHSLPRLYQPLRGSEMAKQGNFSVSEDTLRQLTGRKGVIDDLLELSKLEKLNGTYYRGLVKLREEMHWQKGKIHGQFNQTTAQTGRLSSSKPNTQNFASDIQDIFTSRYDN